MNGSYAMVFGMVDSSPRVFEEQFQKTMVSISGCAGGSFGRDALAVFSDDALIKRSRGLHEGDIVMVVGTPGCVDGCAAVYATEFVLVSKNKFGVSAQMRAPALSEFSKIENTVRMTGTVACCANGSLGLAADAPEIIRGRAPSSVALNVRLEAPCGAVPGDRVRFYGGIEKGRYLGVAHGEQGGRN